MTKPTIRNTFYGTEVCYDMDNFIYIDKQEGTITYLTFLKDVNGNECGFENINGVWSKVSSGTGSFLE